MFHSITFPAKFFCVLQRQNVTTLSVLLIKIFENYSMEPSKRQWLILNIYRTILTLTVHISVYQLTFQFKFYVWGLMRLAGGSSIKKMYIRLIKIFNKRKAEGKKELKEYNSSTSMIFSDNCEEELIKILDFQPRYAYQDEEVYYFFSQSLHFLKKHQFSEWL